MARIFLSPPHASGRELELVADAISSNWLHRSARTSSASSASLELRRRASRPGAVERHGRPASRARRPRDRCRRRGGLLVVDVRGDRQRDPRTPVPRRSSSTAMPASWTRSRLLDQAIRSSPPGARVAPCSRSTCTASARLRRPGRGLQAPRRPAGPGRRRVARRHLPGAAGRRPGRVGGVLLQRQRDHHDRAAGAAGLRRRGRSRTRASLDAGAGPGAHYEHSELGFNYRLSERPRRSRPRPARGAGRSRGRAA